MRTSRLFSPVELLQGAIVQLDAKQSHYLSKVLRLKTGEKVIFFDGVSHFDYQAVIIEIGKKVSVEIESKQPNHKESPLDIAIYQALSKSEHIDLTLQKCTELGVNSFTIFNSERTQNHLKSKVLEKKLKHWESVIQSACEQCGRSITPKIKFSANLNSVLEQTGTRQLYLLDFLGKPIQQALKNEDLNSVGILLGAEGGLSNSEIQLAEQSGFKKIYLGSRVLRTETAAMTATALFQLLKGDLG
ncbi:MAG: 16S rRNA (uracil(1498)-N(3))-methyltransferase [Gammaproteobacteria bacterium]|nr:16S rRNA (uracil(1498)-N(3))-methyltransferase [Gammaproteobacteria bacterium]